MALTRLAQEALEHAKVLDSFMLSHGLDAKESPYDSPIDLPSDLRQSRKALTDVAHEMKRLAQGPENTLMEMGRLCISEVVLSEIYDHGLADLVPSSGSASYEEVAQASGLAADLVKRLLRHAMSNHIFTEDKASRVCHTAISRLMLKASSFHPVLGVMLHETAPAVRMLPQAFRSYNYSEEPDEAAYCLANEPGLPMFGFLGKNPDRSQRFNQAMKQWASAPNFSLKHLINSFPWESVDKSGALLVDVGGGYGTCSLALADKTKNLRFIVQDMQAMTLTGEQMLATSYKQRVSFMEHDFFAEQPVKNADVYFLRWILHDWSDKYAIKILQNLIPAMGPKSRIFLYEWELSDGPETRLTEAHGRNSDFVMLCQFNGRERSVSDFQSLCEKANSRLYIRDVHTTTGTKMALVEIGLKGSAFKIDTHCHAYPPALNDAIEKAGNDGTGWVTPPWTPQTADAANVALGISASIFSVTTPGALIEPHPEASASLARACNSYLASLRDAAPHCRGFFATLPSLIHTSLALAEIEYSLDILRADGISLFTSYGQTDKYLGHPDFAPIWAELSRRKAVVFVHPTDRADKRTVGPHLPAPLIDYPHETGRTAIDLLVRGTLRTHPSCRVILSHAGGDLPWLVHRAAVVMPHTPLSNGSSTEDIVEQAREFYFDSALSSGPLSLPALLAFARPNHVLFGSDLPNAPAKAVDTFTGWIEDAAVDEQQQQSIARDAALALFPRLRGSIEAEEQQLAHRPV